MDYCPKTLNYLKISKKFEIFFSNFNNLKKIENLLAKDRLNVYSEDLSSGIPFLTGRNNSDDSGLFLLLDYP